MILNNFWAHVVRCAYYSHGSLISILQNFRNAEVAEFYCVVTRQENIAAFQISVQYFASMNVF